MEVIHNLDGVYRARFKGNHEQLAAWNSARNVAWPGPAPEPGQPDPPPAGEGTQAA